MERVPNIAANRLSLQVLLELVFHEAGSRNDEALDE